MKLIVIISLCLSFLCGCAAQGTSYTGKNSKVNYLSVQKLKSILISNKENDFDSKHLISVEGDVNLKYRGQQFLLLGEDDCLQLVVPDAIAKDNLDSFKARIKGHIITIGKNEDEILTKYKINNVDVYPYCTFTSNSFLVVDELEKIK